MNSLTQINAQNECRALTRTRVIGGDVRERRMPRNNLANLDIQCNKVVTTYYNLHLHTGERYGLSINLYYLLYSRSLANMLNQYILTRNFSLQIFMQIIFGGFSPAEVFFTRAEAMGR